MVQFQEEIKKIHPGIFTHSIYIDEDEQEDRRAGFVSLHSPSTTFLHPFNTHPLHSNYTVFLLLFIVMEWTEWAHWSCSVSD